MRTAATCWHIHLQHRANITQQGLLIIWLISGLLVNKRPLLYTEKVSLPLEKHQFLSYPVFAEASQLSLALSLFLFGNSFSQFNFLGG